MRISTQSSRSFWFYWAASRSACRSLNVEPVCFHYSFRLLLWRSPAVEPVLALLLRVDVLMFLTVAADFEQQLPALLPVVLFQLSVEMSTAKMTRRPNVSCYCRTNNSCRRAIVRSCRLPNIWCCTYNRFPTQTSGAVVEKTTCLCLVCWCCRSLWCRINQRNHSIVQTEGCW